MSDEVRDFIMFLFSVMFAVIIVLLVSFNSPEWEHEQPEPLPQQTYLSIKPISYRMIPCNVAGSEDEFDYVIEISTRDLETTNEIINILNGGLYHE